MTDQNVACGDIRWAVRRCRFSASRTASTPPTLDSRRHCLQSVWTPLINCVQFFYLLTRWH